MRKICKLSIIIPIFNESKYLNILFKRIINADSLFLKKEIIFIDDGSSDKSVETLTKLIKKYDDLPNLVIKSVFKKNNEGKGAAIVSGLKLSTGDIILIQDADLEYNPKNYKNLLNPFFKKEKIAVYGSRTLGIKLFKNKYSNIFYYVGGRLLTLYVNFLFGLKLTDQPTGYKLFPKNIIPKLISPIFQKDFSFEIEMTYVIQKNKLDIIEVPISYTPRNIKSGKKIRFYDFCKSVYIGFKYRYFKYGYR